MKSNILNDFFKYVLSLFVLYMLMTSCCPPCKERITSKKISPDGKYMVVEYWGDCGAMANGPIQFSILKLPDTLPPHFGNITNCDCISIGRWKGSDTLVMRVNIIDPKIEFAINKFEDVIISYEGITDTIPSKCYFTSFENHSDTIFFYPGLSPTFPVPLKIPKSNLSIELKSGKVLNILITKEYIMLETMKFYKDIDVVMKTVIIPGKLVPGNISQTQEKELIDLFKDNEKEN